MIYALIIFYLAAPVVVGIAVIFYALTKPPDRIQLATGALFVTSLVYFAQAYALSKRDDSMGIAVAAASAYALFVYICMGALAVYFKRWAWRASLAIFGLHIAACLVVSPSAFQGGGQGVAALLASLFIGAVGLWALLHRGSRLAVATASGSEA